MASLVLYEDDSLIVLNKPVGMPTMNKVGGIKPAVEDYLLENWPHLEAKPVHRLDNDTSGCIIAAKTRESFLALRRQFDDKLVEKEYLALLVGTLSGKKTFSQPIAHHPRHKNRMIVCTTQQEAKKLQARPAKTIVEPVEYLPPTVGRPLSYTLCRVWMKSGVRHQIRVHCASAGHPLAGDRLYQTGKIARNDRLNPAGHVLHAQAITFTHPVSGKVIRVETPYPHDMCIRMGSGPKRCSIHAG